MTQEIINKIKYGKPMGATSFVAVPVDRYNSLSDSQREEIRRFDPFLRRFHQKGVGDVYIFWLEQRQMEVIYNAQ